MKILYVSEKSLFYSKGFSLFEKELLTNEIIKSVIINYWNTSFFSLFSFTRRILRIEITGMYERRGIKLCIAKKGIFIKEINSIKFIKTFAIPRGSRPLNLCFSSSDNIYFGEYFANAEKKAVHIYGSKDGGYNWNIVYTFPDGSINHIHGVFYDKYTERIWFCTGDRENECIIGYTNNEFKSIVEVFRGGQEYRTCNLFFYKEFIIYATDSQYVKNTINKIDRKTLKITTLQNIQGSAIKGGQVGEISFLSTAVEPSKVNNDNNAHVWVSKGGLKWKEVYKGKKDCLPSTLFQFGTFEFPEYNIADDLKTLHFTGRALKGLHGKTLSVDLDL